MVTMQWSRFNWPRRCTSYFLIQGGLKGICDLSQCWSFCASSGAVMTIIFGCLLELWRSFSSCRVIFWSCYDGHFRSSRPHQGRLHTLISSTTRPHQPGLIRLGFIPSYLHQPGLIKQALLDQENRIVCSFLFSASYSWPNFAYLPAAIVTWGRCRPAWCRNQIWEVWLAVEHTVGAAAGSVPAAGRPSWPEFSCLPPKAVTWEQQLQLGLGAIVLATLMLSGRVFGAVVTASFMMRLRMIWDRERDKSRSTNLAQPHVTNPLLSFSKNCWRADSAALIQIFPHGGHPPSLERTHIWRILCRRRCKVEDIW